QWRLQTRIPVFTIVDFGDAVAAVLQAIVRAQQPAFYLLRLRPLAASHKHVADRQFAQALVKQISKLIARRNSVEIRLVLLLCLGEIEAVVVRIVEEVALNPPSLVIDLLPHGAGLDIHLPAVQFERADAGFRRAARSGWLVG